ncbi:GDSL-type esterase/lipase family protein [Fictibacillus iocasae]|uniref:GDSL-type esterase/lipase family protein n=1 Tax=Fictibacillus iocasae TaxID=2715437 RepID=A0ABW2NR51_9BACL
MEKTLICFGDSLTADDYSPDGSLRLTPRLQQELNGWNVLNAGVPGETTAAAIKRLEDEVLNRNPDCVTILFGANDASDHRFVSLEQYEMNLSVMIEKIGAEKVILISPSPVNESLQKARRNAVLLQYRNKTIDLAQKFDTGHFDLWSVMNAADYKNLLEEDGLHFNERAYEWFAHQFLVYFKVWQRNI